MAYADHSQHAKPVPVSRRHGPGGENAFFALRFSHGHKAVLLHACFRVIITLSFR